MNLDAFVAGAAVTAANRGNGYHSRLSRPGASVRHPIATRPQSSELSHVHDFPGARALST